MPNPRRTIGISRRTLRYSSQLRDMGCTMTPLRHTPSKLGTRPGSDSTVARIVRGSSPIRSHKSLLPDLSTVPHRRLRRTKSFTLPRKKCNATTGGIFQSSSVATNFPAEKGPATSLSPGGLLKPVSAFAGQCMRCKTHSVRRYSR